MADIWNGIRKKINNGKKCYDKNEMAEALETWIPAWEQLKKNVKNAEMPIELCEVDEATDYVYGFEEWLPQIATAYIVLKKWDEAIAFCDEVKEIFAWKNTRPDEYNQTIGMIYNMSGESDKAKEWFEKWYAEEPDNFECVMSCALYWAGIGEKEKAEKIVDSMFDGVECTMDNQMQFSRAYSFFHVSGNEEKAQYYKKISDEVFHKFLKDPIKYAPESIEEDEEWENDYWYEDVPKKQPVIKDKKIYPNDPCPCGSGKKYKKCCGKN